MKTFLCALLLCGSLMMVSPSLGSAAYVQGQVVVFVLDDDPVARRRRRRHYRNAHPWGWNG